MSAPRGSRTPGFDRLMVLLVIVFGVVVLGAPLLGRGVLLDVNTLTRFQPFQALDGSDTARTIICRSDPFDFYMPGIAATKAGFLSGHFPTWAPYEVGGTPLASLPNHASLSPLSIPYYLLPLWLAPAFVLLAQVVVAMGGMFGFLRRHRLGRGPALFAGLVFVSSGFMIMWNGWPHTKVAAFVPALFWALERVVQERRARDVVLTGVVVASMLLGGFPAVALFALTLAGAYVVVRALVVGGRRPARTVGILALSAGGVLLGLGLSAVQILPFAKELSTFDLAERSQAIGGHLPLALFTTTVAPSVEGLCVNGQRFGPVGVIEAVGYVGAAAMVLVVVALLARGADGRAARSVRLFALVAMVVVGILVWVGGPLLIALQQLPLFSSNGLSRAQSIFGFLGAVLAAVGLEVLLRRSRRLPDHEPEGGTDDGPGGSATHVASRRTGVVVRALLVLALVGLVVVVLRALHTYAEQTDDPGHFARALVVPGLLILGALLAVALTLWGPRRIRSLGPVVVVLLAVGQSTAFAHTMLPLSSRANFYPVTSTHAFLQDHIGRDRYAPGDGTMSQATSDWYRLRTPVGHEFTAETWKDLLLEADPDVQLTRTYSQFSPVMDLERVGRSAVLDQLAVRYWVSAPGDVAGRSTRFPAGARGTTALRSGRTLTCEIAGGPLRAVAIRLDRRRTVPPQSTARLNVAVHTPSGTIRGSQALWTRTPSGAGRRNTAVLGEDLPAGGRYRVDLSVSDLSGSLRIRSADGAPACAPVRPADDGLRLVHTSAGANVWERPGSLPRVRWASRSEVVPDAADRVARLGDGVRDDTVLLDDDSTPAAQGRPGRVRAVSERPERITTDVTTQGRGYLVVADAIVRQGWTATVDGAPADLVPGNHAFAAVPVPAGRHRVVLSYRAPGLREGSAITAGSGLVALGLLLAPLARRRRRETIAGVATQGSAPPDPRP